MPATSHSRAGVLPVLPAAILHGVLETACAASVFSMQGIPGPGGFYRFVIVYNLLAFGLRVPAGLAVDRLAAPRAAMLLGCMATASAVLFRGEPAWLVFMAGAGNALFHAGGGSISLDLKPGGASAPGVFICTGAAGLLLGMFLGGGGRLAPWPFLLLALLAGVFYFVKLPARAAHPAAPSPLAQGAPPLRLEITAALILLAAALGSFVSFALHFPWKSDPLLLCALAAATVLGRGAGGFVADRFGWLRTVLCASLLSLPLLMAGTAHPFLAIPGVFLFNLAAPVMTAAIAVLFQGRPAFSFGLVSAALLAGAIPAFTGFAGHWSNGQLGVLSFFLLIPVLCGALMLYCKTGPARLREGEAGA